MIFPPLVLLERLRILKEPFPQAILICVFLFCDILFLTESQVAEAAVAPATSKSPSPAEQWIKRSKEPTPWMSWGAELRLREEYYNNASTLNQEATDSEFNYQRTRTRIWSNLHPAPCWELDARLTWEWRNYVKPESREGAELDEMIFDHLNMRISPGQESPWSLTLGRQDIQFGNRWLIYDGTTVDGSRTDFFDAARLVYDWKEWQTVLNAIYVNQASAPDRWLPPINDQDRPLTEEDTQAAILYVINKSIPHMQWDGYFIYKNDNKVLPRGNDAEEYIFGARVEGERGNHWRYRFEFAPELGEKNGQDFRAFGANSLISYFVKDRLNNNFRLGYEYLSGDDPDTDTQEGFDPLWSRRAQFSELLVFTFPLEAGGRLSEWTNFQRLGMGWSFNPLPKLEFSADYHFLLANENPQRGRPGYSVDGNIRGHLWSAVLKWTWTQHLSGHLWAEYFVPGNYYSDPMNDPALFFRAQIIATY